MYNDYDNFESKIVHSWIRNLTLLLYSLHLAKSLIAVNMLR